MKEINQKMYVPENCNTCLYGKGIGCSNANRQNDWLRYCLIGCGCPDYWLDQNRYELASGHRGSSYYNKN